MTASETQASKTLNKKEQASLQMRLTILNTTIEILGSEGYGEVTASNLSKRAGISKGALYHHFTNLDEIRYEALTVLIEELMQPYDPAHYQSLQDFLNATGETVLATVQDNPVSTKALYVFLTRALVDDAVKEQLQVLVRHALDQYQRTFHHFCPDLSQEELSKLVWIVDAYYGGSVLQWNIMSDPKASEASWNKFTDLVLQYTESKTGG